MLNLYNLDYLRPLLTPIESFPEPPGADGLKDNPSDWIYLVSNLGTADQQFYKIPRYNHDPQSLMQLGIDYPIVICDDFEDQTKVKQPLRADEICAGRKDIKPVRVRINHSGFLELIDWPCIPHLKPKHKEELVVESDYHKSRLYLLCTYEHLNRHYMSAKEAGKCYKSPDWSLPVYTVLLYDALDDIVVSETYFHLSALKKLPVRRPPEYYHFTSELEFLPTPVTNYFTKEELVEYDALRKNGYCKNSSVLNIEGVSVGAVPNGGQVEKPLAAIISPAVEICEERLYRVEISWKELEKHKRELYEAVKPRKVLTIEHILYWELDQLDHFLETLGLTLYERMDFIAKVQQFRNAK